MPNAKSRALKETRKLNAPKKGSEAKSLEQLWLKLSPNFDAKDTWNEAIAESKNYRKNRKLAIEQRYHLLAQAYRIYIAAANGCEISTWISTECARRDIKLKATTHFSVRVVRLLLRPSREAASRYARALRAASRQNIPPEKLFGQLMAEGGGIRALCRSSTGSKRIDNSAGANKAADKIECARIQLEIEEEAFAAWEAGASKVVLAVIRPTGKHKGIIKHIVRGKHDRKKNRRAER